MKKKHHRQHTNLNERKSPNDDNPGQKSNRLERIWPAFLNIFIVILWPILFGSVFWMLTNGVNDNPVDSLIRSFKNGPFLFVIGLTMFVSMSFLIAASIICIMYKIGKGYPMAFVLEVAFDQNSNMPLWMRLFIKTGIYSFMFFMALVVCYKAVQ